MIIVADVKEKSTVYLNSKIRLNTNILFSLSQYLTNPDLF